VAALVSITEPTNQPNKRLSFPEPLARVSAYEIPVKNSSTESSEDLQEETETDIEPEVAAEIINVPLGSLLPCSCCKKTIRVPRNPYTSHKKAARALPNSFFIRHDNDIESGIKNNKLVVVNDGRGYRINKLKYSKALLLPEVLALLVEMGNDYADALEGTDSEGTVFRVTSLTRTEDQQKKLIIKNKNATRGISTHSYGASFDIAFMDRPNEKGNCNLPTREIQKLLLKYQNEGRIYIIPEGGCMHITLVRFP
tara:strand:+ start:383 stop:1144 length:762 start_codon:yes stop_codon:yes gene_type:complete